MTYMEWMGKHSKGEFTLTHVPSGLVFKTWEDAKKWEAYISKKKSDN